jgi:hypothetical protein
MRPNSLSRRHPVCRFNTLRLVLVKACPWVFALGRFDPSKMGFELGITRNLRTTTTDEQDLFAYEVEPLIPIVLRAKSES